MTNWSFASGLILTTLISSGCAFDVVQLKKYPTQFEAAVTSDEVWVLKDDVTVKLARGWATPLKKGTLWQKVGTTPDGDVYKTHSQVVTVEASNMFEADPVINRGEIIGFYLPVEKSYTPADPPVIVSLIKS
jgi:hypothetical protein